MCKRVLSHKLQKEHRNITDMNRKLRDTLEVLENVSINYPERKELLK